MADNGAIQGIGSQRSSSIQQWGGQGQNHAVGNQAKTSQQQSAQEMAGANAAAQMGQAQQQQGAGGAATGQQDSSDLSQEAITDLQSALSGGGADALSQADQLIQALLGQQGGANNTQLQDAENQIQTAEQAGGGDQDQINQAIQDLGGSPTTTGAQGQGGAQQAQVPNAISGPGAAQQTQQLQHH